MTETSEKNVRRIRSSRLISTLAVILLVGTALMSLLLIAPLSNAEPTLDDGLLDTMTITPGEVYTTSEQYVLIDYTLKADIDIDYDEIDIVVSVVNGSVDEQIFTWNKTAMSGAVAPTQISWLWDATAPAALVPNDYDVVMNITVNGTPGYNFDVETVDFTIIDGSNMISDVTVDPTSVINDGAGEIDLTWTINRMAADMDGTGEVYYNLWNDYAMEWIWEENLTLEEVVNDPDNMTMVDNGDHMIFTYTYTVPELGYVGTYDLMLNGTDDYEYNEIHTEDDAFTVGWMELPAQQLEDTIEFEEDMYVVANLTNFFIDFNNDELTYYTNMTTLENITYAMVDDLTMNFTAPLNWNGQESFEVIVNDTKVNATYTIDVVVTPVNDVVAPAADRTILVNENTKEAAFTPKDLYYDPDDEITYNVSLGYTETLNETTNVTTYEPVWAFEDDNFTVTIDETNNTKGMAVLKTDLEKGEAVFPLVLWFNETTILENSTTTGTVMVDEVNDMPVLAVASIDGFINEARTVDLDDIFTDADGPELNYTNVTAGANIAVAYDNVTHMVTITPDVNWTGTTSLSVNVTDSVDYEVFSIPVNFVVRTYTISGHLEFVDAETHLVDVDNESKIVTVVFYQGNDSFEVETNATTGNYSIELAEGEYTMGVIFALDDALVYEADVQSGYMADLPESIDLTEDMTVDIDCTWETVTLFEVAAWEDLDFANATINEEDGEYNVTLPIVEGSDDKVGFGDIDVKFVLVNDDDEKFTFNMTWDGEKYYVFLTKDDMEDVKKGKVDYYFTDAVGEIKEGEDEKTFKSDDNADLITIIVLVVLIVLVLVALVFIMRKPAEEEFDDEEEEEEESSERICPGCGESVTDEDAEECPYCGDSLEEE